MERKTIELIVKHPLHPDGIYEAVLKVWEDIFKSGIGSKPFKIGVDLFPRPQIMAFFLHELIPLEFSFRYPGKWRREQTPDEKDMVYIPDPFFSIEIKASSNPKHIFGNRSYAQKSIKAKKSKSGYYLAINFEKFSKKSSSLPRILRVRFGWLDHEDWIGQKSATGQQARLSPEADNFKLIELPLNLN